jgi:hypothetical protein
MPVEYVTRESLGLGPIKHRQDLLKAKIEFVEKCVVRENKTIKKLIGYHDPFYDRYGHGNYPSETDVNKARHDHKCHRDGCKKTIKKGDFYFRRSFGQMWTIKACSIRCFLACLP